MFLFIFVNICGRKILHLSLSKGKKNESLLVKLYENVYICLCIIYTYLLYTYMLLSSSFINRGIKIEEHELNFSHGGCNRLKESDRKYIIFMSIQLSNNYFNFWIYVAQIIYFLCVYIYVS